MTLVSMATAASVHEGVEHHLGECVSLLCVSGSSELGVYTSRARCSTAPATALLSAEQRFLTRPRAVGAEW